MLQTNNLGKSEKVEAGLFFYYQYLTRKGSDWIQQMNRVIINQKEVQFSCQGQISEYLDHLSELLESWAKIMTINSDLTSLNPNATLCIPKKQKAAYT